MLATGPSSRVPADMCADAGPENAHTLDVLIACSGCEAAGASEVSVQEEKCTDLQAVSGVCCS